MAIMTPSRLTAAVLLLSLAFLPSARAQEKSKPADPNKLPLTGLTPAKILPDLCLLKYRVTTTSPECQALVDQGLGFFYSYVWMEAARSFETAVKHDPDCALAWWGLSRALERWGKANAVSNQALLKADELKGKASDRERLLIQARMQEKGLAPGVGDPEKRKKAATATIDDMIALYDEDEEAWYYRAQLAGGDGLFGGKASAVPFYKALLRVNPLHPGANHELVHFYENFRRPALGWPYAEAYMKSSPGIPHPFHMQAHLAMRIGRWANTTNWSSHAIELEKAYHKEMNVKPSQDAQYAHHLETLLKSLIHDGRFREARAVKEEAQRNKIQHWIYWFNLHLAERNWDDAQLVIQHFRKDKLTASYLSALLYLRKGEVSRAAPEVAVLQEAYQAKRHDKQLEMRLWETQGMLMCRTGSAEGGVKLLAKTIERTKNDYGHHAWGNGAYYMEAWGIAALLGGKLDVAEEAFLEALAHDPGCVRAALGLQVLCQRQGRSEEAARYADLARKCWQRADAGCREAELEALRGGELSTKGQDQKSIGRR
jgi:tetratricopeptide (TPR) repeat protein